MTRWLRSRGKGFWLSAAIIVAILGAWFTVLQVTADPETGPAYGRTSEESQRLNDAFLNYVRMNNPELRSEPDGNLLLVGYKVCTNLHSFSELTLTNMAEVAYPGAGRRIYEGATQYLCEEGS